MKWVTIGAGLAATLRRHARRGGPTGDIPLNAFLAELKRRNVLRVAAAYLVLSWLLVQVGSVLLPTFHAPEWVMQSFVLLLAAGLVATLVFSWVYELTPEGLKRDSEVDLSESIAPLTARKLDIVVIVLLLAVAGVTIATRNTGLGIAVIVLLLAMAGMAIATRNRAFPTGLSSQPVATQGEASPSTATSRPAAAPVDRRPSVAVLPFVNMSALAENEYFADGLSETLLNMLAQVPGLKVAARTSAFAFKGSKTDIRKIAQELNVRSVLEGSVQRAGTRVRITAQLIDAAEGSQLWSKSYDRMLDDIFAIQDEIATAVAAELTRSLLGAIPAPAPKVASPDTRNAAAYDLYLRGLEQHNVNSYGSLPRAERLIKDALEADPGFSDARILLARTYLGMAETGLLGLPEAVQRGRALLAPLLAGADPDPIALACDAMLQWRTAGPADKDRAASHAREITLRALEQRPNDVALHALAAKLLQEDKSQAPKVLALLDHGLAVDPLSPSLLNAKGWRLLNMGRYDEALAAHARARELAPEMPAGYYRAGQVYTARGPYVEAVKWYARASAIDRDDHELPVSVAQHLIAMGLTEEAGPWMRRAELLNAAGSDTRRVLMLYAAEAGDAARALSLSADVIRERRDNRRNVYGTALFVHFTLMHESGKLDAALALLESVLPGLLDVPPKPLDNDFAIVGLWTASQFLPDRWNVAERAAVVDALTAAATKLEPANFEFASGGIDVVLAALAGDEAGAAEMLSALLATPRSLPWHWRMFLRSPALARVVQDPRVVAAVAKLEADFAHQATRYRALVAAGEIVVP